MQLKGKTNYKSHLYEAYFSSDNSKGFHDKTNKF